MSPKKDGNVVQRAQFYKSPPKQENKLENSTTEQIFIFIDFLQIHRQLQQSEFEVTLAVSGLAQKASALQQSTYALNRTKHSLNFNTEAEESAVCRADTKPMCIINQKNVFPALLLTETCITW